MMRANKQLIGLGAALLVGTAYTGVRAELPDNQSIHYLIHETPSDPESHVIFTVILDLEAVSSNGSSVGWWIATVEFRRPGGSGGADTVWVEASPEVGTPDDLWWVEHADPMEPQVGEFADVPYMQGTAPPEDPPEGDLDYRFEGDVYACQPSAEPPYANTISLSYFFDAADDPPVEGDDEPVEIPDNAGGST